MEGCKIRCSVVDNNSRSIDEGKIYKNSSIFYQNKISHQTKKNKGINLNFSNRERHSDFSLQQSFQKIPLWENESKSDKKISKKSLLSYMLSMSFIVISLSFLSNKFIGGTDYVGAKSQTDTDFVLNAKNQIFIENKNVGIGTIEPNYKLEVSGAMFLEDSKVPISSANHSGIYSNKGELYVLDAFGNSTKISSHDKNGLWQYSSTNNSGKNLEIEMESLTKELNKMLGGGYIIENGKVIDKGENTIQKLTLQINENVGTLEELKGSVDSNLKIINKEINKYDKKIEDISESVAKIEKNKDKQKDSFDSIQEKVNNIALENESLLNFFLAINPDTLVYLDKDGNLNLDGIISAKEISAKNMTAEKIYLVSDDSNQSLGNSVLKKGETNVFISNRSIEGNDKIFITPTISTKQNIAITDIKSGEGFTVSIVEPEDKDITFSWFILNEIDKKNKEKKSNNEIIITPPSQDQIP